MKLKKRVKALNKEDKNFVKIPQSELSMKLKLKKNDDLNPQRETSKQEKQLNVQVFSSQTPPLIFYRIFLKFQ